MDFVIVFFRDVLDGPLYVAIVIINSILICSCIGYLAEQSLNRKKAKEKFSNTYTSVGNSTGVSVFQGQVQSQSVLQPNVAGIQQGANNQQNVNQVNSLQSNAQSVGQQVVNNNTGNNTQIK